MVIVRQLVSEVMTCDLLFSRGLNNLTTTTTASTTRSRAPPAPTPPMPPPTPAAPWVASAASSTAATASRRNNCQAPDHRLAKKGLSQHHHPQQQQPRRAGGRSLLSEGLLNCGFGQGSTSSTSSKSLSHSRSGRSEDFFYIKVSHKPRPVYQRVGSMDNHVAGDDGHVESKGRVPLKLLPVTSKKAPAAPAKSYIHCTASSESAGTTRSSSSTVADSGQNNLDTTPGPRGTSRSPDGHGSKADTFSVNGGNANANPNPSPPRFDRAGEKDRGRGFAVTDGDSGPRSLADGPGALLAETGGGGSRSPISTDELLIERLEHRLLERESELQDASSFEEKEVSTCQLFEERQRYCVTEMEGLKQRCSTKLRQVSQRAARNHQALQLQVTQLQAEKESLQEDISRLTQEKDLAETTNTQLAPTLEDIQWELKDCQADVNHKLNEIVSLKRAGTKIDALEEQSQEDQERIRTRTVEVEVCQNELHRKKNEADLLREKVGRLETDIQAMKAGPGLGQRAETPAPGARCRRGAEEEEEEEEEEDQEDHSAPPDSLRGEVERTAAAAPRGGGVPRGSGRRLRAGAADVDKEKERVIRYQKQLQYNYMQMHKKNLDLERILKELTAELEGRAELDGVDGPYGCPGLQTYDDVIATEI
ncbi:hypothetical protein CRUP_038327 [Coryphaenoides rupestris]|nr:hypothetical protein CRUP_038327 [Coryphaenoides rupestris]